MRLLLDTHVFVWFIDGDPTLPAAIERAISDPGNEVFLRVAAVWEASIKYHLGKWRLSTPPEILFPEQRQRHRIASVPVDEDSVAAAATLPLLHRDPFDRIMIGQAIFYELWLVTMDRAIRSYPMAPIFAP